MSAPPIRVEIWSDVVCPWCYIGKRRFESAVEQLDGEIELDVVYRPYQLDPTASPGTSQPVIEAYAKKFGGPDQARAIIERVTQEAAGEGVEFRMDRALRANTLLAHRLLWLAELPGSPTDQSALKERLLQAYFIDGLDIGDPEVLADCAAEVGFPRQDVVDFLESGGGRAEVAAYLDQAIDSGISAVPTFVVNGQWAIPGAQDADTFVNVIRRLHEKVAADATAEREAAEHDTNAACSDDVCET
ncbi:DsbA family oxidoreductase [Ilumatobacter sp.]|uniref:DsbA family oxidoreductase n=1 Tax=Ilumatobacter sp. TaxID=1967498 RepID=UPI003AF488C8